MGRERQKFKNRSSVSKVKHKPKSKKKILQNPVIAANWNQKETLSQNYRRLGLASKLNHYAGGTEKSAADVEKQQQPTDPQAEKSLNIRSKLPTKLEVSEVRIERDPSTGAILRVLDDPSAVRNPLNDPLNALENNDDDEGWQGFVDEHGMTDQAAMSRPKTGKTAVVRTLEEQAGQVGEKKVRKQSEREREWVQALVDKYGDDYQRMSRDRELNVMQQSVGDIRKRVRKWQASKGR